MGVALVATPEISIATGGMMSIRCGTPGARIFYTIDGSVPTDHAALWSKPVIVAASAKVRAIAVSDDLRDSMIAGRIETR